MVALPVERGIYTEDFRVSPNVGQKNRLNKVWMAPLKWERDSNDLRSGLKTTSLPTPGPSPHLDQGQKIVYRANTRVAFPPFALRSSNLESVMDSKGALAP